MTIEDHRMQKIYLKKLPKIDQNTVIGFLDETSPQTTANTQRLWSFGKPTICKNTTKIKANAFGFYAINGISAIDFEPNSKKESVCDFLKTIWKANIGKSIILILDNFSSHKAKDTRKFAEEHGINLIFLPPYSPDLNPIEFIWKSIKREVSCEFIRDAGHLKNLIKEYFYRFSAKHSFAANWIDVFLGNGLSIIS
jgi:putative transposase